MTNIEAIEKIESVLSYDYHFTDYDFGGMNDFTEKKCPRPEKIEWLAEQFATLMNRLKEFLKTNPNKIELCEFLLNEVKNIDLGKYKKEEFHLLIAKYNEVPHFGLLNGTVIRYYEGNKETFNYVEI
jgi:hypothetical protein